MRYSTAAVVLAGSALAQYDLPSQYDVPSPAPAPVSTDYETRLVTITSCAPEITNCPANAATPTAITTSYVPLTTSTIYSEKVHTITSCPPNVVKCPAHSTVVSTETIAVSTTVCPVGEETGTPETPGQPEQPKPTATGEKPGQPEQPKPTETGAKPVTPATTKGPEAPVCVPTNSVTAITKSYTTVLTSVEYSTIQVPCATGGVPPAGPTGGVPVPPAPVTVPPPSGGNTTVPQPPAVTAGAASFAGSAFFAALAGVAAYVLA